MPEKLGALYGRPDIERCDLFIDMGYLNWGKFTKPGLPDSCKGRQILPGVPGKKCGIQGLSGYFDPVYIRGFDKDKYIDPFQRTRPKSGKPYLAGEWVPPGKSKKHATPGDIFGTFVKPDQVKAFSPLLKPTPGKGPPLPNFYTNPGKKGNCGYLDICLSKYPEHAYMGKVDDYDGAQKMYRKNWVDHKGKFLGGPYISTFYPKPFFDEAVYRNNPAGSPYVQPKEKALGESKGIFVPPGYPKKPGNNHDGCFSKWPPWQPEKYMTLIECKKALTKVDPKYAGLIFFPEPQIKTNYTPSVVNYNADFCTNERTWRSMKPITYPQFNY